MSLWVLHSIITFIIISKVGTTTGSRLIKPAQEKKLDLLSDMLEFTISQPSISICMTDDYH